MDRAQMPKVLNLFKKAPLPIPGGGIFLAKRGRGCFLRPFRLRCACKADIKAV